MVASEVGVLGTVYVSLLGLVGITLTLIGLKGMSDCCKEGGIFNNALCATRTVIIGTVAGIGAHARRSFLSQ